MQPQRHQPTRLCRPWNSLGKNTGMGCHFLLQCMKVKSESEDAQSCSSLREPMDCSLPGSSIHGIFQARVLEWGAIAFSMHTHTPTHTHTHTHIYIYTHTYVCTNIHICVYFNKSKFMFIGYFKFLCNEIKNYAYGFSRQEYWSGLPFPSPMHESEK